MLSAWPTQRARARLRGEVDQQEEATTPTIVVERFLELLRAADVDRAVLLLAPDVEYTNVSLPAVHGGERVRQLFRAGYERGGGFEVYMHTISAAGPSVLTERRDVLKAGQATRPAMGVWTFRRS
jgi:limonene-1,2-epoxide hydrolase